MGMPCTNCSCDVDPKDAKFFGVSGTGEVPNAAVFVCPDCYATAELFDQRAREQLKAFLTLSRECIRLAIVERRLFIGPLQPARELTKREVFQSLLQLTETKDGTRKASNE